MRCVGSATAHAEDKEPPLIVADLSKQCNGFFNSNNVERSSNLLDLCKKLFGKIQ
jgi:hypothetical protein